MSDVTPDSNEILAFRYRHGVLSGQGITNPIGLAIVPQPDR